MPRKARRPFSKSEWFLLLAPLLVLAGFGLYSVLRPLFPRTMSGHKGQITQLDFSPDGKKLSVVAIDNFAPKIHVWNVQSQAQMWSDSSSDFGNNYFSDDGKTLAEFTDAGGGRVRFHDAETGKITGEIYGTSSSVFLSGNRVLIQSPPRTLEIRDDIKGADRQIVTSNLAKIVTGGNWRISPNKKLIAFLEGNTLFRAVIWDVEKNQRVSVLPQRKWNFVDFTDDQNLLLGQPTGVRYSINLQSWNWQTKRKASPLIRNIHMFYKLSKSGRQLVFFRNQNEPQAWKPIKNSPLVSDEISMISLPDGKIQWAQKVSGMVTTVFADDNLRFVINASMKNNVSQPEIFLRDGKTGVILKHFPDILAIDISPDGQTIATGDAKGVVRLYDTRRFLH